MMSVYFSEPPNEDYSGLLEDLQSEFMEGVESGDRAKFDFALEHSDAANYALQSLGMQMMQTGGEQMEKVQPAGARATALALWTLCARQAFLDLVEMKVAPMWAEQELPKRIAMFAEMRAEQQEYNRELA